MKTYNLIDKNSDMVITISAENPEEAKSEAHKRVTQGFEFFRTEEVK